MLTLLQLLLNSQAFTCSVLPATIRTVIIFVQQMQNWFSSLAAYWKHLGSFKVLQGFQHAAEVENCLKMRFSNQFLPQNGTVALEAFNSLNITDFIEHGVILNILLRSTLE